MISLPNLFTIHLTFFFKSNSIISDVCLFSIDSEFITISQVKDLEIIKTKIPTIDVWCLKCFSNNLFVFSWFND